MMINIAKIAKWIGPFTPVCNMWTSFNFCANVVDRPHKLPGKENFRSLSEAGPFSVRKKKPEPFENLNELG